MGVLRNIVKDEKYAYSERQRRQTVTALGEKIRQLRTAAGLTLEELGKLTDTSKSYIWELENKNPPRPSAEKIAKIAAVLKVTSDYLVDETGLARQADATDDAFFRKYRGMDDITKERIRKMVDLWDEKE